MTRSPTNRSGTSWLGFRPQSGPLPVLLVQGEGDPDGDRPSHRSRRRSRWWARRTRSPVFPRTTRCWSWTLARLEEPLGRGREPARPPECADRVSGSQATPTRRWRPSASSTRSLSGRSPPSEVKDVPFIAAAIDTFAMLNVLGLAAALLVIGVLVVYLQARQRARSVSNVLSMRMGMRRPAGARRPGARARRDAVRRLRPRRVAWGWWQEG